MNGCYAELNHMIVLFCQQIILMSAYHNQYGNTHIQCNTKTSKNISQQQLQLI